MHMYYFNEPKLDPNIKLRPTGWGDEQYYHDDLGIRHIPTRTKFSHPYSYDPIVQYKNDKESNGSVYSDRLCQWDSEKYKQCALRHFGKDTDNFGSLSSKQIQAFLREYLDDKKLILTQVVEMCNVSNGYPVWFFKYKGFKNV